MKAMKYLLSILVLILTPLVIGCGSEEASDGAFNPEETAPPSSSEIDSDEASGTPDLLTGSVYVIYAQDGTFLGQVDNNQFNSLSICNTFGSYGSSFSSTSIRNSFSSYGGQFGSYSAYNSLTTTPPVIFSYDGSTLTPLYYLTKNTFKNPWIDPDVLIAYFCGT